MNDRTLIVASAGSGKTHTLTSHLAQLIQAGVPPEQLSALTFSRAAAGEIYMELIARLLDKGDVKALRHLVAVQHQVAIGTIDAFLMRLAKFFPEELNLEGEIAIMDDFAHQSARMRAIDSLMLLPGHQAAEWAAALKAWGGARELKRYQGELLKLFEILDHALYAHPDAADWDAHIAAALGVDGEWDQNELGSAVAAAEGYGDLHPKLGEVLSFARNFGGTFAGATTAVKNFMAAWEANTGKVAAFKFGRKEVVFGEVAAQAFGRLAGALYRAALGQLLKRTRGMYALARQLDDAYRKAYTLRGQLVFDDLPKLVSRLGEARRTDIEFRLGMRLAHWALDEFQDTSRLQYAVLKPQLANADSALVVGDPKQAIYGWRGGDVGVFAELYQTPGYRHLPKAESYRYGPEIADAVNRIFAPDLLARLFPMRAAVTEWDKYFKSHAANAEHTRPGAVRVEDLEVAPDVSPVEAAARQIYRYLAQELDFAQSGQTAAVLVRSGQNGRALAARLSELGLKAVWEGDRPVASSRVVAQLLAVLQLAEHPGDKFAQNVVAASPLAAGSFDLAPAAVQASVSRLGLKRTLEAIIAGLPVELARDTAARAELNALLLAAARFESEFGPGMRLQDFIRYARTGRIKNETVFPGVVRVMTIHRSKGLGFDIVCFPDLEHQGLAAYKSDAPLMGRDWVLARPDAVLSTLSPLLARAVAAEKEASLFEELCICYVAATRAKSRLQLLLRPPAKTASATVYFSTLVRAAGVESVDNVVAAPKAAPPQPSDRPRLLPATRISLHHPRLSPSRALADGPVAVGQLFDSVAAAARGTAIHERLAALEWPADLSAIAPGFREAFVPPAPGATVWRERSYELIMGGKWETGQFDRVVFWEQGGQKFARIYDFKTGEVDEEKYAMQLAHYRRALALLTRLDPACISAKLLFANS